MSTVEPDQLGQHMRIARVGLRTRGPMALAITGDLERVDRIDGVARRDQRLDPRTAIGLDPEHHLVRIVVIAEVITSQGVQRGQPDHAFG